MPPRTVYTMSFFPAILSTLVSAVASLTMLVLLIASTPNSTPSALAQIKWLMLAVALVAFLGIGGSIWAMTSHRLSLATLIGIAPAVFSAILLLALLILQS